MQSGFYIACQAQKSFHAYVPSFSSLQWVNNEIEADNIFRAHLLIKQDSPPFSS
jgi:hypothetical protein